MRGKITIRSVEALAADDGKEVTLRDSGLAGFEVRARAGGAKVYGIRYRIGGGRDAAMKRFTIGRHGSPWTAETARAEAKRLLALVAQGKDPAGAKAAAKAAPTVAEFAARFLAEHAEAKRKASTAAEYHRLLDHVVLPAIGKKRVADVTRQDVAKLHYARRATPTEANRALAVTSTMFNIAERWGLRPDGSNPCRHVEKFPSASASGCLSAEELARLGDALAAYEGSPLLHRGDQAIGLHRRPARRGAEPAMAMGRFRARRGAAARQQDRAPRPCTCRRRRLKCSPQLPRIEGNPSVIVGAQSRCGAGQPRKAVAGDPQGGRA